MPQKRTSRRPRRKRANRKKRVPSNKTLSKQIKHIKNDLIELKYVDVYTASTNLTSTPSNFNGWNLIANGDQADERVGDKISPVSLILRWSITTVTALVLPMKVRMFVYWDTQTNLAVPLANSVFDTSIITDTVFAPRFQQFIDRYVFLYDKTFTINTMQQGATAGTTTLPFGVSGIIKLKLGRVIRYIGAIANINTISSNSINVAYVTDSATTGQANLELGGRMYFRDA